MTNKHLVEALKAQKIVGGSAALAEEIASTGEVLEIARGAKLIEQGHDDTHVYLIVAGAFHIVVNGKTIARRVVNDHIGEMAAILPVQRRAASALAEEPSVVVRLTHAEIDELGRRYSQIWRCLALELAHRVEQRNTLSTGASERVRVLIVSSAAAAGVARLIGKSFENEPFQAAVLPGGIFKGFGNTIEHLEALVDQADIAVAVAEPEDLARSGGEEGVSPRDSIIFELGFFMGRLGRHRAFLIEPEGEEVRLPPALAGINTLTYRYGNGRNLQDSFAPLCGRLRSTILELGPNR
jgi:CRP/FNR family transcriptional regulator, cyclic AMP receptor protein